VFDLAAYIAEKNKHVNRSLVSAFRDVDASGRIVAAMQYSLMAGGKRLRPILCLAANEAVGGKETEALPAACALEMIHTYSLIHDDLPAMDNDDLRRGKPTCHVAFDEATAILAGDALLTLAFQILSATPMRSEKHSRKWLEIIHTVSTAAGYRGMIEGQMLDILSEGKTLSLTQLESMHKLKTGALIQASLQCGVIIGGGTSAQMAALEVYARNIGLAFQVTDDILNIEGDPQVMGKAAGTDALRNKITYPALLGLEESKAFAQDLVRNALKALEDFDRRSDPLRALSKYIIERHR
jgi:geranylgeranyl diphosphate synthase type II